MTGGMKRVLHLLSAEEGLCGRTLACDPLRFVRLFNSSRNAFQLLLSGVSQLQDHDYGMFVLLTCFTIS